MSFQLIRTFFRFFALVFATMCLSALFFVVGSTGAEAATVSWDGGGDGSTWEDELNWDNDTDVGAADDVTIDAAVTVTISAGVTVNSLTLGNSGGTNAATLRFNYDAIVDDDPLVIDDGNLTVHPAADIDHTAGTSSVVGQVYIDVQTGDVDIDGTMNVSFLGYENGGPCQGNAVFGSGAGGGYGGTGGFARHSSAGTTFVSGGCATGSIDQPVSYGSSGESTDGDGGGSIRLTVAGTLTVDGSITAEGDPGSGTAGSGAGGSIWIQADTVAGSGTISADGGDGGASNNVGAGGGGRVALYYTTSNAITPTAIGGDAQSNQRNGGAGTVFIKDTDDTYGDLLIDNDDLFDAWGGWHGTTPTGSTAYTFDTITLQNSGNLQIDSDGDFTYTTLSWDTGVISDFGGTFTDFSSGTADLTIPTNAYLFANTSRTFNSVTVNGTIDQSPTIDAMDVHAATFTTTSDFTVAVGGSINMVASGYLSNLGDGAGADSGGWGSGAGHGGQGGDSDDGADTGGDTYDDTDGPVLPGSGGGSDGNFGGAGGGAIKLVVGGDLTLNEDVDVSANTTNTGTDTGGGAGGSIWFVITGGLYGDGNLTANGGPAQESRAGAGGGGIITYSCAGSSWTGTTSVVAGTTGNAGDDGVVNSSGCPVGFPPTGSFNSASQKTDGSGEVTVSIEVDDPDDDDTRAKIEYETDSDGACDGPWSAATLTGTATADFNDSGGAPDVGAGAYQVGSTATTRIITSSGSNSVSFDWDSDTDLPTANGTQCLRLTVNDDTSDQTTPATQTVSVDNVVPTLSSVTMLDTDSDGTIDRVDAQFSENLALTSYSSGDWAFTAPGSANLDDTNVTISTDTARIAVSADANVTGGTTASTLTYTNNSNRLTDSVGNPAATFGSAQTVTDGAGPLVLSTSPLDGATDTSTTDDVVITFTEPIDTGTFTYTFSDEPTGVSVAYSSGNAVATLSHTGAFTVGSHTFTVTAADDPTGNNFAGAVTSDDNPLNFTVIAPSSGKTSGTYVLHNDVEVNNGDVCSATSNVTLRLSGFDIGEYLVSDEPLFITAARETFVQQGTTDVILEGYDTGVPYQDIPWTLGADGVVYARYFSTTGIASSIVSDTIVVDPEGACVGVGAGTEAEETDEIGESPVTGTTEPISLVKANQFIRGESFKTIYYVGEDLLRHPLAYNSVFYTYEEDDSIIVTVTDATLATLQVGEIYLPKPESVLIKFFDSPKVYVLLEDEDEPYKPTLRHIQNEQVATALVGVGWQQYIYEMSPVFYRHFDTGFQIRMTEIITDISKLKKLF